MKEIELFNKMQLERIALKFYNYPPFLHINMQFCETVGTYFNLQGWNEFTRNRKGSCALPCYHCTNYYFCYLLYIKTIDLIWKTTEVPMYNFKNKSEINENKMLLRILATEKYNTST